MEKWEAAKRTLFTPNGTMSYRMVSGRCIPTDHSPQLLSKNAHNGIVRPMSASISELLAMTVVTHFLLWGHLSVERAVNKNNRFDYRNFKFPSRR